jgi:molybdopterin/thiamine biosynthesis adenylyltransferase
MPVPAWLAQRLKEEARPDDAGRTALDLDTLRRICAETEIPQRELEAQALDLGVSPLRYLRNRETFSPEEQARLSRARVALVGLGGLGGSVLEGLVRMGVGRIRTADGDRFEETNLNRQALATTETLGQHKADAALERARLLNPAVEVEAWPRFLTPQDMIEFCELADMVIDALGGIEDRPSLRIAAASLGLPLVSAAVAGWTGYVALIPAGGTAPDAFFPDPSATAEHSLGSPAPTVELAASLQCATVLRILSGQQQIPPRTRALFFDLASCSFENVDF